ncbi:hypothetical protein, partial [Pontibacter sp. 172403-2]|uniref:hypothetical protein n=1 Tax=Pontibacter rufus TaxID=2791028 RepID=UPI001E2F7A97
AEINVVEFPSFEGSLATAITYHNSCYLGKLLSGRLQGAGFGTFEGGARAAIAIWLGVKTFFMSVKCPVA